MNYSKDFLAWDAEQIATKAFKSGQRVNDLYQNPEFTKIVETAVEEGVDGQIHEMIGDLSRQYEEVLYNPENL